MIHLSEQVKLAELETYQVIVKSHGQHILTSTKNTSLIITDFLSMIYENEQPRTASLCRGWTMFEI